MNGSLNSEQPVGVGICWASVGLVQIMIETELYSKETLRNFTFVSPPLAKKRGGDHPVMIVGHSTRHVRGALWWIVHKQNY